LQNPKDRAEFKEKLAKYLAIAKEESERFEIWFWDETGFSLRAIRRKSWGQRGQGKKVSGQRRRGRVNVMGGVRESDRKRVCFFIKKGDTDTFYEQLNQCHKFVTKEWIERGNQEKDFQDVEPKIIVV